MAKRINEMSPSLGKWNFHRWLTHLKTFHLQQIWIIRYANEKRFLSEGTVFIQFPNDKEISFVIKFHPKGDESVSAYYAGTGNILELDKVVQKLGSNIYSSLIRFARQENFVEFDNLLEALGEIDYCDMERMEKDWEGLKRVLQAKQQKRAKKKGKDPNQLSFGFF